MRMRSHTHTCTHKYILKLEVIAILLEYRVFEGEREEGLNLDSKSGGRGRSFRENEISSKFFQRK